MIGFGDWFTNLCVSFPQLHKRFGKQRISDFKEGIIYPNHKQAMKICDVVGKTEKEKQLYREQLEKILRYWQTPRTQTEKHIIMYRPKAAPRPRFSRKTGRAYNPKEYTAYKEELAEIMKHIGTKTRCIIDLEFHFVSQGAIWGPHEKKPDGDNLLKSWQDAAQMAGLKPDDCQFWDVRIRKFYSFSEKIICSITT